MSVENWRDTISAMLGEPKFSGERTWIWKSEECEFSYLLNFNGGFVVCISLTQEDKFFDFYYNDFQDVKKSAKYYSKYFAEKE